jgi:hypothetical protein
VSLPSFKRRVGAGGVLLLGATALGVWLALRAEPEAQGDEQPMPSPPLGSAIAPSQAPGPARTASSAGEGANASASLSEIDRLRIQGLTGNDPLVAIQALREMRVPGSFASAHEIVRGCLVAHMAPQFVKLNDFVNTPSYAKRLSAMQAAEARCSRVFAVDLDAYKPLPGDVHGEQYLSAKVKVQNWHLHKTELPELLQTLAEQGRMVDASGFLRETRPWNGERWKGDAETYSFAVGIAGLRVTGDAAQANQDLRLLANCIKWDRCHGGYEYFPPGFPEHRKSEVLALAAEMETAFRTGDPRPFLGKKP